MLPLAADGRAADTALSTSGYNNHPSFFFLDTLGGLSPEFHVHSDTSFDHRKSFVRWLKQPCFSILEHRLGITTKNL